MRLPPEAPVAGPILDRMVKMEEIQRLLQKGLPTFFVRRVSIGTVRRAPSRARHTSCTWTRSSEYQSATHLHDLLLGDFSRRLVRRDKTTATKKLVEVESLSVQKSVPRSEEKDLEAGGSSAAEIERRRQCETAKIR